MNKMKNNYPDGFDERLLDGEGDIDELFEKYDGDPDAYDSDDSDFED